MSDKDLDRLVEANFTPQQRVCLDYVAASAARKVIEEYGTQLVFRLAGKAALGMLVLCTVLGAIVVGALRALAPRGAPILLAGALALATGCSLVETANTRTERLGKRTEVVVRQADTTLEDYSKLAQTGAVALADVAATVRGSGEQIALAAGEYKTLAATLSRVLERLGIALERAIYIIAIALGLIGVAWAWRIVRRA
jgi:hypothetical protein